MWLAASLVAHFLPFGLPPPNSASVSLAPLLALPQCSIVCLVPLAQRRIPPHPPPPGAPPSVCVWVNPASTECCQRAFREGCGTTVPLSIPQMGNFFWPFLVSSIRAPESSGAQHHCLDRFLPCRARWALSSTPSCRSILLTDHHQYTTISSCAWIDDPKGSPCLPYFARQTGMHHTDTHPSDS